MMKMADRAILPTPNPPCKNCPDRWVNSTGTCHSSCERYIAWNAKWQAHRKKIRDHSNRDHDVSDFEVTSAMKTRRKKKAAR